MSGVEACIGIGVQNAGWRNPPVQAWGKTFPPHLCALTPADQNTLPEPAHAKFEDAQLGRVPGNSVVLVITQHTTYPRETSWWPGTELVRADDAGARKNPYWAELFRKCVLSSATSCWKFELGRSFSRSGPSGRRHLCTRDCWLPANTAARHRGGWQPTVPPKYSLLDQLGEYC
jgi:hypothetical protein